MVPWGLQPLAAEGRGLFPGVQREWCHEVTFDVNGLDIGVCYAACQRKQVKSDQTNDSGVAIQDAGATR